MTARCLEVEDNFGIPANVYIFEVFGSIGSAGSAGSAGSTGANIIELFSA